MPRVEPRASEAVGAILNGQWRLLRMIGEGGLAAVYEAESTRGEGKRAIKLLHRQYVRQRTIVERFYGEAKACFNLRHPHIAGVEAYAYAEDGSPYIVMELLHGMSLEDFLRQKQPMTPAMAAPLVFAVLQALSVAHGSGIVHRDLKPANLFLVPEGTASDGTMKYTIKVLDFGIAKVMDVAGGIGTKTRTGAVLGTPGYMSPEQVKNAKTVDARTDLWAAGVVFYEMLCCHHPYGSADQLARMVAVMRDEPTRLSQHAPHLAHWDDFFVRALARDPDERFQSAEQMGETIRHRAQGSPARFIPDGLQTVSLPQMPDLMRGAQGAAPSVVQVTPAPQTSAGTQQMQAVPESQGGPGTMKGGYHHASSPPPATGPSAGGGPANVVQGSVGATSAAAPSVGQPSATHHAGSIPPQPTGTAQGHTPPVPGGYPASPASLYGDPSRKPGATQVSADRPAGTPSIHSDVPPVYVEDARDEDAPSLVWWAVVLLATGTFALGVMLGYVLAG